MKGRKEPENERTRRSRLEMDMCISIVATASHRSTPPAQRNHSPAAFTIRETNAGDNSTVPNGRTIRRRYRNTEKPTGSRLAVSAAG